MIVAIKKESGLKTKNPGLFAETGVALMVFGNLLAKPPSRT
jgi:hypothetical protein